MNTFHETDEFIDWIKGLTDRQARLRSAMIGNFGDCKPIESGVWEMRIDYGPGYRVYYGRKGKTDIGLFLAATSEARSGISSAPRSYGKRFRRASMIKTRESDPANYLKTEEDIAEYLAICLEDPNPDVFLAALGDAIRARGMTKIAKDTGLRRESLYKAFTPGKKPHFETILKITKALGVSLSVKSSVS